MYFYTLNYKKIESRPAEKSNWAPGSAEEVSLTLMPEALMLPIKKKKR